MRIVLPREEFLEAVSWTARILPAKPYTPILGGVHIRTDGATTSFAAYDTEVSARINLAHTPDKAADYGEVLVSGRLLAQISKVLPKQDVELWDHGKGSSTMFLRCGKAEFSLPGMAAEAYPVLPTLPEATAAVDAPDLANAINQVIGAASHDQAQPQLMSILWECTSQHQANLWATDKHRAACRDLSWSPLKPELIGQKLLIPVRAAAEMASLGSEEHVYLGFDNAENGTLGIRAGKRNMTTRLYEGAFPNCRSVLPKAHGRVCKVGTEELLGALQRALLLDPGEFPRVRLGFAETELKFSAGTDMGGIADSISVEYRGEALGISVNPRYLMDAVGGARADEILLGMGSPKSPMLLTPFEDWPKRDSLSNWPQLKGEYLALVMPTL